MKFPDSSIPLEKFALPDHLPLSGFYGMTPGIAGPNRPAVPLHRPHMCF